MAGQDGPMSERVQTPRELAVEWLAETFGTDVRIDGADQRSLTALLEQAQRQAREAVAAEVDAYAKSFHGEGHVWDMVRVNICGAANYLRALDVGGQEEVSR